MLNEGNFVQIFIVVENMYTIVPYIHNGSPVKA